MSTHNIYLLIITLKVTEWIKHKNQDPSTYCLQEIPFRRKDKYRLKAKGWRKIFCTNGNGGGGAGKKARLAILKSEKKDFKIKTTPRDNKVIL